MKKNSFLLLLIIKQENLKNCLTFIYTLYEQGRYNETPILVGYNSDEGLSFNPAKTPKDYIDGVNKRYGKFANKLAKAYPVDSDNIPKTARDLARDAAFGWQTWAWANLQTKRSNAKVFFYYFDQHPDFAQGTPQYGQGTPHGHDVGFVFGHTDPNSKLKTSTDESLSDAMVGYWTNFAKYGNPNGDGLPEWKAYTKKNHAVMHLNQKPKMGSVPSEKAMRVLDKYFQWRRTKEGKEWGLNDR